MIVEVGRLDAVGAAYLLYGGGLGRLDTSFFPLQRCGEYGGEKRGARASGSRISKAGGRWAYSYGHKLPLMTTMSWWAHLYDRHRVFPRGCNSRAAFEDSMVLRLTLWPWLLMSMFVVSRVFLWRASRPCDDRRRGRQ